MTAQAALQQADTIITNVKKLSQGRPLVPFRYTEKGRITIGAMAASGDSAVWVAHLDRYRLELWSRKGDLFRLVDRPAPWFSSREDGENAAGVRYHQISGLYDDPSSAKTSSALRLLTF